MEYCKLEKVESGNFYYNGASSMAMDTLAFFFTDDVGGCITSWLDFVDSDRTGKAGNASELDKDGDFIILGDLLYYGDNRTDTLTIHKDDFIKMLLGWEELYNQKPDEIIITQDDQGKITMVGKFNDGCEI